ncbi:MAG: 3-hydroxyacyl-ACP dehydratase FabZ [Candidatus Omnitrophota bacterium]
MQLDIAEIQQIIPHRYPFLLIDRIVELEPNEKLVAIKNVSVNEQFFQGHFPEEKVMPGVLITEAMAQAGCIYFYYSKNKQGKKLIYYLGKISVKFYAPVVPGDQLRIEVKTVKLMSAAGVLQGEAFVGEKKVAGGEFVFSTKEIE